MLEKIDEAKNYLGIILPWIVAIGLSSWGGFVAHVTRHKRKITMKGLVFDIIVSSFAGILTHLLCKSAGISPTFSAALIAISGHMGTRAIAGIEVIYTKFLGGIGNEN